MLDATIRHQLQHVSPSDAPPPDARSLWRRGRRRRALRNGTLGVSAAVVVAGAAAVIGTVGSAAPGPQVTEIVAAAPTGRATPAASPTSMPSGMATAYDLRPGPYAKALLAALAPVWPREGLDTGYELEAGSIGADVPSGNALRDKRREGGAVVQWASSEPVTGNSPAIVSVTQFDLAGTLTDDELLTLDNGQTVVWNSAGSDGAVLRIYARYGAGQQRGLLYRPGAGVGDGVFFFDYSGSPDQEGLNLAGLQRLLEAANR